MASSIVWDLSRQREFTGSYIDPFIQHFECLEKVDAKTEKKVYEILVDLKHCYKECETTTHIFIDRNGVTQEIK